METYDWLIPNVTCTPTTMHCPLPTVWAHINYTTPSLYPEPAEGSCLQQKSGSSSLNGCFDKMNLDEREYSANSPTSSAPGMSQQNTNEEDNGQGVGSDKYTYQYSNWAGNCGDASSYFWFEKIACGSTRTFHTDRSLIFDYVQLTPTWEDVQMILDIYYTTKAPLSGADTGKGFTFVTSDYNVPPVLPPKINCSCTSSMDAYASLLSVVSKTPSPGAPVTLDPEVLNSGTSKIIATLRMYQDPTYSIPASSDTILPIVVTRFYLEVSTKFTRNRITISDCNASHTEATLNASAVLKPRMNYCDNSTFDTMTERSPNGITGRHMDPRILLEKFNIMSCPRHRSHQNVSVRFLAWMQLFSIASFVLVWVSPVEVDITTANTNSRSRQGLPKQGITHMDRISMKKFKFQGTIDVFMQCKMRACARQPCGVCTGFNNRQLQYQFDTSPGEGESYTPTLQVQLAQQDPNALVFPQIGLDPIPVAAKAPQSQLVAGLVKVGVFGQVFYNNCCHSFLLAKRLL